MTASEVQAAFTAELQALLDKWDAELFAFDYYIYGEDIRMEITIPAILDGKRQIEREYTCFDIGNIMSAKK
jgi:hypothetical protein